MSNQTYSIKDTLALTKAQAGSDTGGVLLMLQVLNL